VKQLWRYKRKDREELKTGAEELCFQPTLTWGGDGTRAFVGAGERSGKGME